MAAQTTAHGAILALNGEFGVSQRDRLKRAFDEVARDGCVVVDVSKTAFIDSTVLGSLLQFRGDFRPFGGDVTLHAGPDRQAHVLLPVIPKR